MILGENFKILASVCMVKLDLEIRLVMFSNDNKVILPIYGNIKLGWRPSSSFLKGLAKQGIGFLNLFAQHQWCCS